jgi:hypothetical protein
VRYTDGTVKISSTGTFPESFHTLAGQYMKTKGLMSKIAQTSTVLNVFFGCDESIIVHTESGYLANGLPTKVTDLISRALKAGLSLGKNTSLCPWNSNYYYLEFIAPGPRGILGLNFKIWEENTPLEKVIQRMMDCDVFDLSREEKKTWTTLFMSSRPYPGADHITGEVAATMFNSTNVNEETLCKIWELSDQDVNGRFSLDEFLVAIRLIYAALAGMGMPETLPVSWVQSSTGESVIDMSTTSLDDPAGDLEAMLQDMSLAENWEDSAAASSETSDTTSRANENPSTASTPSKPSKQAGPSARSKNGDSTTRKGDDDQLKDSLAASIVSEKPNVKWEDVAGLEAAKDELQEAVVLPLRFPQMFKGKRQARRGMLLYGPPGTGKSYLAKAIATEVDHTLFSISSSDVMSKWLGDSER